MRKCFSRNSHQLNPILFVIMIFLQFPHNGFTVLPEAIKAKASSSHEQTSIRTPMIHIMKQLHLSKFIVFQIKTNNVVLPHPIDRPI
ncbi:hypothetical protein LguiB_013656 [Lonicera macranthoides]